MSEQQASAGSSKSAFRRFFRYEWILDNIGFFLFLAALAVVYIANGHMADKSIRDADKTAKELKELQYEYKTLKSEVMFRSRESEITRAAAPMGLKIDSVPPVRIVLEKKDDKK